MTNTQPFYHRCTIIFTGKRALTESEVQTRLAERFAKGPIVAHSVTVEEWQEPEAGDPADLV